MPTEETVTTSGTTGTVPPAASPDSGQADNTTPPAGGTDSSQPLAPAAPAAPEKPAPAPSVDDAIAEHNRKLEEEAAAVADPDTEKKPEEVAAGDAAPDAAATGEPFKFTDNADFETFQTEAAEALKQIDLSGAPEVQAIIDRLQTEVTTLRAVSFEAYGGKEKVDEVMNAVNAIYDVEIGENDEVIKNVAPVVDYFEKTLNKDLSLVATELFSRDSKKYQGASIFQEVLVDTYPGTNAEKLKQVDAFLKSNIPLPDVAPPKGKFLPEALNDAWKQTPEVNRFEIEALAAEIEEDRAALGDVSSFLLPDRQKELAAKEAKLAGHLQMLTQAQAGIDSARQTTERTTRQVAEERKKFEADTYQVHMVESANLLDEAAKALSTKLDFIGADQQLPVARDMMARVGSALSFVINDDGTFNDDPMADYYVKQMKEEGVQFDFKAARDLLKKSYTATRTVERLKKMGESALVIAKAEEKRSGLLRDIKAEQVELIGQLSSKRVKSASTTIEQKAAAALAKKQVNRVVPRGEGAGASKKSTLKDVDSDISKYNANVKTGDDLFEQYAR